MLVRAVLFCVTLMAAAVTVAFPATTERRDRAAEPYPQCWLQAVRDFQLSLPMDPVEAEILRQAPLWPPRRVPDAYAPALKRYLDRRCAPPPPNRRASRAGLALGALGAGGITLYWLSPYQQILLRGLRRLHPTRRSGTPRGYRPDLADAVQRLADDTGVTVHGVWLNASDYTRNAVAFGHWRRRHIELASGMEALFDEDPGTFEVVVRHELGHIRHRDLDLTYGVTALWAAFNLLLVATFGFAVSGYAGEGAYLIRLSFHFVLLALLLHAARNTFLQSRELHADAFAVSGPQAADTGEEDRAEEGTAEERRRKLDEFFTALSAQRPHNNRASRTFVLGGRAPTARKTAQSRRFHWPFATHPALHRRRAALRNPALAGELGVWEAALTGCVAMFAVNLLLGNSFDLMMTGLGLGFVDVDTLRPLYSWLAIPLLLPTGAVLGTGIRHTVAAWDGIRGGRRLAGRLTLLAVGLWAGLYAGCVLHPAMTFGSGTSTQLGTMWWHGVTGVIGLGLALTAALSVLALTLLALACDALCAPRAPRAPLVLCAPRAPRAAFWCVGTYGVLTAAAWFPSALPGGIAPYLLTTVTVVALLSGLAVVFLRRVPGGPAPAPPTPQREGQSS
ncbi:M48 family metalloprotease [Streptomyces sp. NPDC096152]|uniref:M48 family metalloprotease n=1 Tax=Streptomyces sp. NPDC096152 TaxID=3366078 RepID=UPI0037FB8C7E